MGTFRVKDRLSIEDEAVLNNYRDTLIEIFTTILNKHNVTWWADWGTLLGIIRDGDFIRHDNDMDFSIMPNTFTREFYNELKSHKNITIIGKTNRKFFDRIEGKDNDWLTDYCGGPTVYLTDNNGDIQKVKGRSVKLDMFFAWKYGDFYIYRWSDEFYRMPSELIESTIIKTEFRGHVINIHSKAKELLAWYYTDNWETPKIGFHKKDCIPKHKYFYEAAVNAEMVKTFKYNWKKYKVEIDLSKLKDPKKLF